MRAPSANRKGRMHAATTEPPPLDLVHVEEATVGAMLLPIFAAADRDGRSCYLEMPSVDNARYYPGRGFRVAAETDVPNGDVDD